MGFVALGGGVVREVIGDLSAATPPTSADAHTYSVRGVYARGICTCAIYC